MAKEKEETAPAPEQATVPPSVEQATVTSTWRSLLNMLTLAIRTTERSFNALDNAVETVEYHAVEMRNKTVTEGDKRKTLASLV